MKLVIQRVQKASVSVMGEKISSINKGLLIFLGISANDNEKMIETYTDKLLKLRIFEDEDGKTNKSIVDVGGDFLVVSQFTLYADCKKGNRPSFTLAANPQFANELYEKFALRLQEKFQSIFPNKKVATGLFGANMQVSLQNDGPFTILWDSDEWC